MGSTRNAESKVREGAGTKAATRGWRAALVEMLIILALYVAYSGSRLFASDSLRPAQRRAGKQRPVREDVSFRSPGRPQG